MTNQTKPLLLSLLLLLLSLHHSTCRSNNRSTTPHPHKGKLTPYTPGPFSLRLASSDEETLSKGDSVTKQIAGDGGSGGRAICVQDVESPRDAVWRQILGLDEYVGKVNKLKECGNYEVKEVDGGRWRIKTKMVVGVLPGYSYEYYCDHTYSPKDNSLTWTLDYDKTSDFDDVAGHWHLEDHPTKPKCTRVFYACDIAFKSPVPGPIRNFLTKSALRQATSWVKRESESHPGATIPRPFGVGVPELAMK